MQLAGSQKTVKAISLAASGHPARPVVYVFSGLELVLNWLITDSVFCHEIYRGCGRQFCHWGECNVRVGRREPARTRGHDVITCRAVSQKYAQGQQAIADQIIDKQRHLTNHRRCRGPLRVLLAF